MILDLIWKTFLCVLKLEYCTFVRQPIVDFFVDKHRWVLAAYCVCGLGCVSYLKSFLCVLLFTYNVCWSHSEEAAKVRFTAANNSFTQDFVKKMEDRKFHWYSQFITNAYNAKCGHQITHISKFNQWKLKYSLHEFYSFYAERKNQHNFMTQLYHYWRNSQFNISKATPLPCLDKVIFFSGLKVFSDHL